MKDESIFFSKRLPTDSVDTGTGTYRILVQRWVCALLQSSQFPGDVARQVQEVKQKIPQRYVPTP
jgi:hypothetical protein